MKKLSVVLLSFFASSIAFAQLLTFDANNVIEHANIRDSDYNIEVISSNEGLSCITSAIAGINEGRTPKGISDIYSIAYRFNNDGYTKSVIAHFCGSTAYFVGIAPQF